MRIIGRFMDKRQVGAAVDSLRNIGFDRKDMIISDMAEEQKFNTIEEAAEEIAWTKTERNGQGEIEPFWQGIKGLEGREGILVAVEGPKHSGSKIREVLEQSGAVEIVQD